MAIAASKVIRHTEPCFAVFFFVIASRRGAASDQSAVESGNRRDACRF
jgi:hypothetical protein